MIAAGEIVFQPLSVDLQSFAIGLHEIMMLRKPRFSHVGVAGSGGEMYSACGKVLSQPDGATGNISLPYKWNNWVTSEAWLKEQIGKPYDWTAWAMCLLSPIVYWLRSAKTKQGCFTCSSLVGAALKRDGNSAIILGTRVVTPDDVARVVGAL